jgi:integrase
MRDTDYYRSRKNGLLYVKVPVPGSTRRKGVCTGQRTLPAAREIVASTGVDRLVHLAQARVVTAEAVSIVTCGRVWTFGEVVEAFSQWVPVVKAPRTAESYITQVRALMTDLACSDRPLADINEKELDRWVNSGDASKSTMTGRLAALRLFYKFAGAKGAIVGNPAELLTVRYRDMTLAQLEKRPVIPFTEEEYQTLLASLTGYWRDFVVLSYCTGFRLGDCAGLERDSFTAKEIVIYPSKGRGKRLALQLDDPLIHRPELRELIDRLSAKVRPGKVCYPEQSLEFFSPKRCYFSIRFATLCKTSGITGKTFHGLRHAFSRRLRAAGKTIEEVSRAMGHDSVEVTKGYTGEV